MNGAFNPYQHWLGINTTTQPDCYTLLGLPWFEADVNKIAVAADQAFKRVQMQETGSFNQEKTALLSEIHSARICLLDSQAKATYDFQLQQSIQAFQASTNQAAQNFQQPGNPSAPSNINPMAPVGNQSNPAPANGNTLGSAAMGPISPPSSAINPMDPMAPVGSAAGPYSSTPANPNPPSYAAPQPTSVVPPVNTTPISASTFPAASPPASAPSNNPLNIPNTSPTAENLKSSSSLGSKKSAAKTAKLRAKSGGKNLLIYGSIAAVFFIGSAIAYKVLILDQPAEMVDNNPSNNSNNPSNNQPKDNQNNNPQNDNRSNFKPGSNRPTADELAKNLPGLGDPNKQLEKMQKEEEMKNQQMNLPPKPTETDITHLQQAIEQTWQQLSQQNFSEAKAALNAVKSIPKTESGKSEYERLNLLVNHLDSYKSSLNKGLDKLREGDELQVGSTKFKVVSNSADKLVIRIASQSRAYEKSTLPEGLKRAIALSQLEEDETVKKAIEGCVVMFSKYADSDHADKLWTQAGVNMTQYLALKEDKLKYLGEGFVSTSNPPKSTNPEMISETQPETPELDKNLVNAMELGRQMQLIREQLSQRNISGAKQTISSAEQLVSLDIHQAKLDRLKELTSLVESFWQAVAEKVKTLAIGEEIVVGPTMAKVVEVTADGRLILRLEGESRTYGLNDLPAGLAMHFAKLQLDETDPQSKVIRGAFLLVEPKGTAKEAKALWEESMFAGKDVRHLYPLIDDQYNLLKDFITQAELPEPAATESAANDFQTRWMSEISKVQRSSDRVKLAEDLLEASIREENGSALQFVMLRYAVAEAARGGDFELMTGIINAWEVRFAIDPWQWQIDAAKLAESSTNSNLFHAELTTHLIQQFDLFKGANQQAKLKTLIGIASSTASKSRDKELVAKVKQLEQML